MDAVEETKTTVEITEKLEAEIDSANEILNLQQIMRRLQVLEDAIYKNAAVIAQLLKLDQQQGGEQLTTIQPEWQHLLNIESTCIMIDNRKTMKLLAINDFGQAFMAQYSNNTVVEAMVAPDKFLPLIPPLLLLLHVNIMHSKAVQRISFKVFVPFMTVLLQAHLHYDNDEYYWYEISAVNPPIYDDAFVVDDIVSAATMQAAIPVENKELAYETYLTVSNAMYCKMIATFVQMNNNHFIFDTSTLLQQVFAAGQ